MTDNNIAKSLLKKWESSGYNDIVLGREIGKEIERAVTAERERIVAALEAEKNRAWLAAIPIDKAIEIVKGER